VNPALKEMSVPLVLETELMNQIVNVHQDISIVVMLNVMLVLGLVLNVFLNLNVLNASTIIKDLLQVVNVLTVG
jgi:hypothetical protein